MSSPSMRVISPQLAPTDFGTFKPYLNPVDLLDARMDDTGVQVNAVGHIDAVDIHGCVITTFGKDVDQHCEREWIFKNGILRVDMRDTGDRMPQDDRDHLLVDNCDHL